MSTVKADTPADVSAQRRGIKNGFLALLGLTACLMLASQVLQ